MTVTNIKIHRVDATEPAFEPSPPYAHVVHIADEPWEVAILEKGMQSGKCSIGLRFNVRVDDKEGRQVWLLAETSLEAFISILAMARGAFPDEFDGTAFDVSLFGGDS